MEPVTDHAAVADALAAYVQETAHVVALRLDVDGYVTDHNVEATRLLGGELLGRQFADLLVGFTRPAHLPDVIEQAAVVHQLTLDTAAGTPETLGFRFFPLPDGTLALGSPDFGEQQVLRDQVLAVNRDLNDLTRQLHQANAELRDLNQLKVQFLGMAAHDLRKPVGVIMTYNEFVLDEAGPSLAPEHRQFLNTSLRAAHEMHQVIDDFLDLAVIESGQLQLNPALTNVAQMLSAAEPLSRLLAERKSVTLLVEPVEPTLRWHADAGKIQHVVLNLLGNAIEHSVPGQRVWLSAREQDHELVVSVRDEGPGLTSTEQAQLFTAFGRAGPKKTAGERSTGLGLSIARLIVEAHGGRLWVETTPGHGATFVFSIPVPSKEQR